MKKILSIVVVMAFTLIMLPTTKVNAVEASYDFDLHANVYDYGEAIDQVKIKVPGVDATTITEDTFKISATGTNTYTLPHDAPSYGVYTDVERTITSVTVESDGTIVLDLETVFGGAGQGTLNYVGGDVSRNLSLDITYTITQNSDYQLQDGSTVATTTLYNQGTIISPEVDKFSAASYSSTSSSLNYQVYVPENAYDGQEHPLIIWLHGNGEGGYTTIQNNTSQLQANRGAVAFASDEAQAIFGGAYVIAPQAPDTWYNNYTNDYIGTLTQLITEYAKNNNVDTDRIYIYGASAGGYMTTRMAIENPDMFAAVVPTCAAIDLAAIRGGVETTADEIKTLEDNNVWVIHSADDGTVDINLSSAFISQNLTNAIFTQYDTVSVDGVTYNGHWSWIYTARNMPVNDQGDDIWTWTAKQALVSTPEAETPDVPETPETEIPEENVDEIDIVNTGDPVSMLMYSMLACGSVATGRVLIKRKK